MGYPESTEGTKDYPYWRGEFEKEFGKRNTMLYREDNWKVGDCHDADSYKVFMILCNKRAEDKTRLDVITAMKAATEENPIRIDDETFWFEEKYW